MVGQERAEAVERLVDRVRLWSRGRGDVRAVAVVGSWARGSATDASDVDVVLLTQVPAIYIDGDDWIAEIGGIRVLRTARWGVITERRVLMPDGIEVEFDIGRPDWASVSPLDADTARVVADGMRSVHDPDGLLRSLSTAAPAKAEGPVAFRR